VIQTSALSLANLALCHKHNSRKRTFPVPCLASATRSGLCVYSKCLMSSHRLWSQCALLSPVPAAQLPAGGRSVQTGSAARGRQTAAEKAACHTYSLAALPGELGLAARHAAPPPPHAAVRSDPGPGQRARARAPCAQRHGSRLPYIPLDPAIAGKVCRTSYLMLPKQLALLLLK
jgi:hypothetical protein